MYVDYASTIFSANLSASSIVYTTREDGSGPVNLTAVLDLHEHAKRRRPWNRAFSISAIKGYEPLIRRRLLQLVEGLAKEAAETESDAKSVSILEWMKLYACVVTETPSYRTNSNVLQPRHGL